MYLRFEKLFTLIVEHEYYDGICGDFDIVIPKATAALGHRGRLLFKTLNNSLVCLFEADSNGTALSRLEDTKLTLGLALRNPYFANYSDHIVDGSAQLYRNIGLLSTLDAPVAVTLCGDYLRYTLTDTERPVTTALKDREGNTLSTQTLAADQTQPDNECDMRALPYGLYELEETYSGNTATSLYYHEPDLLKRGVVAIVEIALEAPSYIGESNYLIQYQAREDTLKYYVLADNYTDIEFDSLTVTDAGFTEDGRSEINFTRVLPTDFTADDMDESIINTNAKKLAVFKSTVALKRSHMPRRKIQLNKNGDVLIPNLPSPRADKPRPDFIIQIEKP